MLPSSTAKPAATTGLNVMSMVMAGGGLRHGQVIGATDRKGHAILERKVTPQDLAATVFTHLDIDTSAQWIDGQAQADRDPAGGRSPDRRAVLRRARPCEVFKRWGFAGLALVLAAGWSYREVAFALDGPKQLSSVTINLDQVEMVTATDKGETVGKNGVYLAGDTPGSTKFVTGRFTLPAGKTPHAAPHPPRRRNHDH